jgi:putative sigma-54 modulation protein
MIIEYTGRQTVVTQKYKDQASAGLKRIEKIANGVTKVVLTVEKYRKLADVTVSHGTQSLVATCQAEEMMKALKEALAKIEQQAVRQRQRSTTTMRHPRSVESVGDVELPAIASA